MKHLNKILSKHINVKQTIASSLSTFFCASALTISTLPISLPSAQAQNTLADFSVLPESIVGDVAANPNILIILDNSGSMGRFTPNENLGIGNVRTGELNAYIEDGITGTQYLRNRTAWDASSSMSNSFQVREAMTRVLSDPLFANRVNVGLMTFDTQECTYDPADNDARNAGTAAAIDATNLLYECTDANGNVIGAPVQRREFNRSTTGLGLLRANIDNLTGDHRDTLLALLAPEPSPYVNEEPLIRNIGTRAFNNGQNVLDTVILGTPPTTLSPALVAADFEPAIGAGSQISRANPIHGKLHPFLEDNAADRDYEGNEFPILSSPDNAFSNGTPLSGSIDTAFRYLLRNDTAVDNRAGLDTARFANGLTLREEGVFNRTSLIAEAIEYPTADQCEGDLIVILLTDGVASQLAPTNLDTGIGADTAQNAAAAGTTQAVAAAERLRRRGAASEDDLGEGETPIELFVIGFNLNGQGALSANAIANAGSGGARPAAIAANNPEQVEDAFEAIFSAALGEGGSRSSLSVVATADSALGSFMQPGFIPLMEPEDNPATIDIDESIGAPVSWTGDLANFFIDEFGNFREDTNGNGELDDSDFGFFLEFDPITELAHVELFLVDDEGIEIDGTRQGVPNGSALGVVTDSDIVDLDNFFDPSFIEISDLTPLWTATERLDALAKDEASISQNRIFSSLPGAAGGRYIMTSVAETPTTGPFVLDDSDMVPFVWSNNANTDTAIDPDEVSLLDLPEANNGVGGDLNPAAENLINFIRGFEGNDNFRNRTLPTNTGGQESFLLGDIIHSSPAQVEAPVLSPTIANSADLAASFRPYQEHYIDRRRMVYVGANDGMLHAFNAGFWDGLDEDDTVENIVVTTEPESGDSVTPFALGQEVWAYVPNSVLPHLKFLSDPNYLADTHVSYVDGSTRAFEAKLFDNEAGDCPVGIADDASAGPNCRYVNGWGTILVVGLRLGGAPYTSDNTPDQTTSTSFLVFDVTDPEVPPVLIAEISNPGFNLGTATPALVRTSVEAGTTSPQIGYSLVIGSGPTDLQSATSTDNSNAELFVYALTGRSAVQSGGTNTVTESSPNSFVGGITTADWNGDDIDDAIYFGTIGGTNANPTGELYRGILGTNSVTILELIDAQGAVEQTPTIPADQLSRDDKYILFGTGRNLVPDDLRLVYPTPNVFAGVIENIDMMDADSVTFGGTIAGTVRDQLDILPTNIPTNENSSLVDNVLGGTVNGDTRGELLVQFGPDDGQFSGWVFELPEGTSRQSAAPFTLEEFVFFTDFEPQLLADVQTEAGDGAEAICVPPGTGFITIFDYRIGFVPAVERFLLSEDVIAPLEERAPVSDTTRFAISGSLLAGGAVLNLGEDSSGNTNIRIKLPGGDQDVKELAGTIFGSLSNFGRSAWREIPIPESVEITP